jgi:AraC-like DNA-binding protein
MCKFCRVQQRVSFRALQKTCAPRFLGFAENKHLLLIVYGCVKPVNSFCAQSFILFEHFEFMRTGLVFLATSRTERNVGRLDKYLDGYATIQFSPRGGVEVGYDDEFFMLAGGPYFWPAHPGARIRFRVASGHKHWAHRHIGFRGALVEQWRREGLWLEKPQSAPPSRSAAQWDAYFDELGALAKRSDGWGRKRAINRLEDLLLELADARAQSQQEKAREAWLPGVLPALTVRPEDGARTAPDYAQIARDAGLSEATLRRRFKRALNTTPHAYFLRSRVDAARTLLLETDLPLKAIAARLGYENVHFFSRQFAQFAGAAPGAFRSSRLAKRVVEN